MTAITSTPRHQGHYILIHYDGSCFGNPGPGGHAAVLRRMDGNTELKRMTVSGHESEQTTNNRMEMTAAAAALEVIKPEEVGPIIMYGDSDLVSKGMTEWIPNWIKRDWKNASRKSVLNRDLWERLLAAAEGKTITWKWVKGHAGNPHNEEVDRIARDEMQTARAKSFGFAA